MTRRMVTHSEAKKLAQYFSINHKIVPFKEWLFGLNVELEHGSINPLTNVTNDDLIMTGKIALAHIMEYPNYYRKLAQMELDLESEWKNKSFNIFIK
jgi:hypothetical protein